MSDTPRTDAEEARYYGKWAKSDFARELERELAAALEQRDKLAEALELFLSRVQYTSILMTGRPRGGGRFDYRSSGFDDEVELAYEALKAMKGAEE